jgi:acetyl esterase/lipase
VTRLLLLAAVLLAACDPRTLSELDSLSVPGTHTRGVAEGISYGPEPRQQLDVYAPEKRGDTPAPVVVFFYGGSWASGSRAGYEFAGRAYASRGFVAVVPDYRLVPKVRFPGFVEDGAAALRWVRANIARFGGDSNRITVAGHSAGAHIGALLALDPHYLRDAGLPPDTIRAAALMSGPYDFLITGKAATRALGQWPRPAETQPFTFARADVAPLWLATGTLDETVLPRNSEVLAARLRALGAPVEFRTYGGANHADLALGLSLTFRGRASTLDDSAAFLLAHSR